MTKKITFKEKEYEIEIKWATQSYCFRIIGVGGFNTIPNECLTDVEKFKPLIIKAIENNHDLKEIELWDGKI
jgi:hypothetical protein